MTNTTPKIQKAPQFALEHFFSAIFDDLQVGSTIPLSKTSSASKKAKSLLGDNLYTLWLNHWDIKPVLHNLKNNPFSALLDLEQFKTFFETFPQHFWELTKNEDNLQFQPVSTSFDSNRSYRGEFLTMQFNKEDCTWMQTLSDWVGGCFKDYWFYTPPNSNSVPLHYDAQNNVIIQLHGTKKWNIYPSKYDNPIFGFSRNSISEEEFKDEDCWEIELQPGDVLLLPRGVPHKAWTTNEASLHLDLNLIVPAKVNIDFLQLWLSMNERSALNNWGTFIPIENIINGNLESSIGLYSKEWIAFHWQNSVEAHFENKWIPHAKKNATKLGLGLLSSYSLYKKRFNTYIEKDYFTIQGFGNIIKLKIEFLPVFESMQSTPINQKTLLNLKKSFPEEMKCMSNLGFFTNPN